MECNKCGLELNSSSNFCPSCGEKIAKLEEIDKKTTEPELVHDHSEPSIASDSTTESPTADAEELQAEEARNFINPILAGPWKRFFARWADVLFFGLISSFVFGYVTAVWFPDVHVALLYNSENEIWLHLIYLPLALMLEALVYSVFGNTFGKYLLNITVINNSRQKIKGMDYFSRNISVWTNGYGLGIPLISLFTQISQFRKLKNNGSTGYDHNAMYRVITSKTSPARVALFVLTYTFLFFGTMTLNVLAEDYERRSVQTNIESVVSEVNTTQVINRNARIANELIAIESQVKSSVPSRIDELTTLIDAQANGLNFTYYYAINGYDFSALTEAEYSQLIEEMHSIVITDSCNNEALAAYNNGGVAFYFEYIDKTDSKVLDLVMPPNSCN